MSSVAAHTIGPDVAMRPDLAREALRIEMQNYSENHYCAGWYCGIEFLLWEKVLALPNSHKSPEAYTCMLLSRVAQGWWHWPRGSGEQYFVAMADWLAIYAEHIKTCNRN